MTLPPPELSPTGAQIALLRSVGYAAFGRHEQDLDVLDVIFDSLVDAPDSRCDERRLRFVGHGITLDVDVRGQADLTVELRVSPAGPVAVESRGSDAGTARLVSFLLSWPNSTRRPVRTAWIML
ncbi:hypothetical protein HPO96_02015 [Kribbella sandramycini]|uniref:Uncharacterized protein n=1 Tax=Kribbella sandramycini TaxID=60450 RepID=A0A7Y4KVZ8_9ACTN|nr:hypothetical protein [Kribbella sandramycini]MBB6568396.1 hypothetical protein [Kribbella sandramycini]NOL39012.1 hypothetical protein [Kribbella sandramycini]